jgi:hypothetical protein
MAPAGAEAGDRPDARQHADVASWFAYHRTGEAHTGALVRFSVDRRWATMVVAVTLGAVGGTLLGVLTAPASQGDPAPVLAPPAAVATTTTRAPRRRSAAG